MDPKRASLLRRLDALRKMTEGNGCTEAEAANAARLASEIIEAYNISLTEQDLQQSNASYREFDLTPDELFNTLHAIAKFTDTRLWRDRSRAPVKVCMAGLPADLDLAEWLLGTISMALNTAQLSSTLDIISGLASSGARVSKSKLWAAGCQSFRVGMAKRISQRLWALKAAQAPITTATGRSLVVVKQDVATEYLRAHNIHLRRGRAISSASSGAHAAGLRAGERVGLSRPMSTNSRPLALPRGS
jgi:hypothetical protein